MTLSVSKTIIAAAIVATSATMASAAPASVTADLNLREGPSTQYAPVSTIPFGESVDVLSCEGAWCEIDWRGIGGFANRSYLAYGFERRPARYTAAPIVVIPPPSPPPGPVVYSVPYYDTPAIYRGGSTDVILGF